MSNLSRKHYQEIAEILGQYLGQGEELGAGWLIGNFADFLAADNPRFDRDQFIEAVRAEAREATV